MSQQVNLEARDPGLDWTGQFSHKQGGYFKLMPKSPLRLSGAALRVSGLHIVSRRLQKAKGETAKLQKTASKSFTATATKPSREHETRTRPAPK